MDSLSKYKSDLLLAFLYLESILLSLVVESKLFFWLLFIGSTVTVFFYCIMLFELPLKKFWESQKRNEVALLVALTVMFNANITVFQNRLLIMVIFLIFYVGFRYLVALLKKDSVSQIQKNALNLSVLFGIFLGSNLLTTILIILQNSLGEAMTVPMNLFLFGLVYIASYYNFLKNKVGKKWAKTYSLVLALILSETSLLSGFYLERYPSIYKAESTSSMAIVTLPLFLVIIYYLIYGLMIHKLENKFTSRVIIEYASVSMVIMITLFVTIRWFAG